ncbi:unnamed protein product [Larinioides sclopetarius]|uniref:Uncharacterized protein n=1 Tax=Larinioides sclopetarius TaxID=280406 RepID=A0AAV2BWM0_9ARAC
MKLFFIFLLSLLSYQCCAGYPVAESELPEDFKNATALESRFVASNETASNDSSPLDMHGVGEKVVNKVKEGIKTVKDKVKGGFDKVKNKVKGGFDKVKDKVKGGFDKVKDKVKDLKDKVGSKGGSGGGSGGGSHRDKYDRDYNRDKYNRDYDRDRYSRDKYRKDSNYGGGSGFSDPNAKWIGLGIGIFMLVGILVVIICFVCKIDKD